jgi:elongation factor G
MCGLGELHLQIIENRLKELFPKEFRLGNVEVSDRHKLLSDDVVSAAEEVIVNGKKETFQIKYEIGPSLQDRQDTNHHKHSLLFQSDSSSNIIEDNSPKYQIGVKHSPDEIWDAMREGFLVSLYTGKDGIPLIQTHIRLQEYAASSPSPQLAFMASESSLRKHLFSVDVATLEPVMNVEIRVDERYSSDVIAELTRARKASIQNVISSGADRVVSASVPLRSMLGYSAVLRSISRGNCSYSMEFRGYEESLRSHLDHDDH